MLVGFALLLQVFFTAPAQVPATFAATQPPHCSTSFFGIPTWYKYLDLEDVKVTDKNGNVTEVIKCQVANFELLGSGTNSGLLLITLALIDILMRVAALVAIAFVIVGGFRYMTAQGEPGQIKSATQTVVGAVVGLVLAILAASIVAFIGGRLG